MPRRSFIGQGDIRFATSVVNIGAPTVAEITAAVRLTGFLTRDGLPRPQAGNTIDISDASTRFNKTGPGTYGGDAMELKFHRDSKGADDDAWTTLPRDAVGYIIITDWGWAQQTNGLGDPAGTPTVGDRCEVWPVVVTSREPTPISDSEDNKFVARMAVTDEPDLDSVVAA